MIFNKHRSDSQMYYTVLDSTQREGPLVRLISGATCDAQNWRTDRRALCAEHILRARARRTKLRHCFVPSIIHLPQLEGAPGARYGGGGTIGKMHEGTRRIQDASLTKKTKRKKRKINWQDFWRSEFRIAFPRVYLSFFC